MTSSCPASRRDFLGRALATCSAALAAPGLLTAADSAHGDDPGFPLVDLHVHLDNSSIDQVLPLSRERNVRFGIVEHAGTKANKYPVVLSNDAELAAFLANLEGKDVYRGVQAEWTDWMSCFSREALARLDYILTDTMTFPAKDGRRIKLWEEGAGDHVDMSNPEAFMDRYVDWHVQILATEPIDLLANVSWLPPALADQYESLWTERRIQKVLDAFLKYEVAMEISSSYQLPRLRFLRQAKAAGLKFTFGSNGRYPKMGLLDYSRATARELGLTAADMFTPAPDGKKAVQRRTW